MVEKSELQKGIAKRIKHIRKIYRHTKEETANFLGVNYFTYIGYEYCKSIIPHEVILEFCNMYHVSVSYIYGQRGLTDQEKDWLSAKFLNL